MTGPEHGQDDHHLRELEAVGLLVTGALEPGERRGVEHHLRSCETCRDELVEVAGLAGLLRRLQPDPVDRLDGPRPAVAEPLRGARERLLTAGRSELHRRRHRRRAVYVAAALLPLALAAAVLLPAKGGPQQAPPLVGMQRVDTSLDVEGALAAEDRRWGTALTVQMRWGATGTATLVAVGRDGSEQTAAHWDTTAGMQVLCQGATSLTRAELARVEVRSAEGTPLLLLPV